MSDEKFCEFEEIPVEQRLTEGGPLLIAFERDLSTCTPEEITRRWVGENKTRVEAALKRPLEEILKSHNPLYYIAERVYFSNKKARNNPKYLYAPYHRDRYCEPVMRYILDRENVAQLCGMIWLGPRDTYKSTFNHGVTPLWFILRMKWLYDFDARVVLRHHKEELAAANLVRLKAKFKRHPWMRRVWEPACPKIGVGAKWHTNTAFSPAWVEDTGDQAEATVRAIGLTASDTGFHADLDLGDDLVTEDHVKSAKIRADASLRYTAKRYTLDPEGKEVNTGTRYHVHDLWSEMINSTEDGRKLYKTVEIKAIEDDDSLAHPYKLTREFLERRRQEELSRNKTDAYWHLQYQNSIKSSGLLIADRTWIKKIRQRDVDPRAWFFILVDSAWKGTKNAGEGCAASIQVWAIERRGSLLLFTLIDGVHSRELTSLDGVKEIFRLMNKYGVFDIGVEESGGYTFRSLLENEATTRGVVINLIDFQTKQTQKHMRMSSHLGAMQKGHVFVAIECNEELLEAYINQVLDFPQLDENDDDALDCAGYTMDPEVQESYAPTWNAKGGKENPYNRQSEIPRRTRHGAC